MLTSNNYTTIFSEHKVAWQNVTACDPTVQSRISSVLPVRFLMKEQFGMVYHALLPGL
jgi:hypothetical protein